MSGMRTGETISDGRVISEEDVVRQGEGDVSFQVREATTICQGPRGRKKRTTGGDACATGDAHPTEDPGQAFQVREAVTVTVPPPHWAQLTEQEEPEHAHHPEPHTDSGKN